MGKVLPNKAVRFDEDGILIVASRHPINCRYTWCDPGINEKSFLPSAEVKTWDVGHLDEDGFLYIHGRVDDIVTVTNGRNVLVRAIEEGCASTRAYRSACSTAPASPSSRRSFRCGGGCGGR